MAPHLQKGHYQPFQATHYDYSKPRKPLKSKDSSIVSILESFYGALNRNRTRPHPYQDAFCSRITVACLRCHPGAAMLAYNHTLRFSPSRRLDMLGSAAANPSASRPGAHPWSGVKIMSSIPQKCSKHRRRLPFGSLSVFGAFNRNRTDDLILTMDALYRLSYKGVSAMERVKGIEPSWSAWEAEVLPLNYTRN